MVERNLKDFFNELKLHDDFYDRLTNFVAAGDTAILQSRVVETMLIDDTWIRTIEDCMFSIEAIVRDPKKYLMSDFEVVNIEKVKKTTSETVRHLSAHTGFIRSIEDDGFINPSKLLVKFVDDDLFIYENRFVNTLINHLFRFIDQRYNAIKNNLDTYDITNLKIKSNFKLRKGFVEYVADLKVKNEPTSLLALQKNQEILAQVELLRKRVLALHSTPFCRDLSLAKPVVPPILKTNIITMQKHYKNCYRLWMYISSFTDMGFSVVVADKLLPIDNDYFDDLAMLIALNLKAMVENHGVRRLTYKKGQFKRRAKRKYRELREIEYTTNFRNVAGFDDRHALNQYFFEKIRDFVMKKENLKATDIQDKIKVETSFRQFFNSLTTMCNEMYSEVIGISKIKVSDEKQTSLQKLGVAYRKQEELCKRYAQLSKLKAAELQKTLIRENTQKIKLEKIRFDYDLLVEKRGVSAKKKRKKATRKVVDEKNKLSNLFLIAERDEEDRMARELSRQETIIAKEQERKAMLAKAREERKEINQIAKEIRRQRLAEEEQKRTPSSEASEENVF
ncbi:MAG: hypothetical protein LBF12_07265 [Christensenellaceae bacterium]|jgi:hypothetical protein|nr:hypothetical protein [Christensenellaceae bacterium]